jgi:PleD family two-component response regulator
LSRLVAEVSDADSAKALLKLADDRLYSAKAQGRR